MARPLFVNSSKMYVVTIPSEFFAYLQGGAEFEPEAQLDDLLADMIWGPVSLVDFQNACRGSQADFKAEQTYLFDAHEVTEEEVIRWVTGQPAVRHYLERHHVTTRHSL
jgi:hypothetical protein